jgi:hypothetical protein
MITIEITGKSFRAMQAHFHKHKTEQVVFLFLSEKASVGETVFSLADYYLVPQCELILESEYHAEVSETAQAKVIKMAWDKGLSLGEIHSHPHSHSAASFSPSDIAGLADFVPHVWWRLKGRPYFAFVFSRTDFDALGWLASPRDPSELDHIRVGNSDHRPTGNTFRMLHDRMKRERARYSRQEALFGEEGQRKIAEVRVAIVGVGGVGSHVAQQLAYLGIKQYVLIDDDRVSQSNLNRLIGAADSDLEKHKVDVLSRLIHTIQPDAEVRRIETSLLSQEAFAAMQGANFVFGCVDTDGVRLVLLELCCTHRKPYIDISTDVPDPKSFGGRQVFTGLAKGCTMCRGELSQREIRRFFATPEQREEDDRIYGVKRSALGETGPSVVSLNGILASIGVTEFTVHITGLRPAFPYLVYRGEMGIVTRPADTPTPNCYYCEGLWNGEDKSDLERFLRNG